MIATIIPFSNSPASILASLNAFKNLTGTLDDLDKEVQKLRIIKRIEAQLSERLPSLARAAPDTALPTNAYQQVLLKLAYGFCMVFGFFDKAASSFLFGSNLFAAIPGLSRLSLLVLTSIYTLLDAFLFYAFEISFLKEALHIELVDDSACALNKIYMEQLDALVNINIMLHRRETFDWDAEIYSQYCQCMTAFNTHLIHKQSTMQDYVQSRLSTAIEYSVMTFGALSSVADSYFMAKTALLALHVSFMSSPLGWAFVVAMVASALVFYYAMGVQSMSKLLHPDRDSFYTLKTGLTLFKDRYEDSSPYTPEIASQRLLTAS
ncbi:MAG: hypothetical protein CK424_04765 [Legionella sp.]|nr:MAG: hypothetical protein CK424_04765 [Legionella sp.]